MGAGLLGLAVLTLGATTAEADAVESGKKVYSTNCVSCHGQTGKGDGPVGAALNPRPRDFSTGDFKLDTDGDGTPGSDADLKNVIKKGAAAFGGSPLMAPWGHLPEQDIENVIAYVRSLKH
jgi:mono/diheme cytochrome c family protein